MQASGTGFNAPVILRALGPAEQYSTARSYLGIYNNVCVAATYTNGHGEELRSALFYSLSNVIKKHPILSAVPVDVPSITSHFVRLRQIELDKVVTFIESPIHNISESSTSHLLDEFLMNEHNLPFKHNNLSIPFWRITVLFNPHDLSSFTLCLCFHHSLADTQSALILHEDLEYELAAFRANEPSPAVVTIPEAELVPSLESLVLLPTSLDFIQGQWSLGEPPQNWWSGKQQSLPVVTKSSSVWLPQASFSRFRVKCKDRSVSLTAGLMSLIARAFFHILPPEYSVVQGDCAVSLRRFLPDDIDRRSVGCYVGSFSETYHRDSFGIWDDAERTKAIIDKTITGRGADMPVGYLKHVSDLTQWLKSKIGKKRWAAWELSNVGALNEAPGLDPRDRQIQGALFSQSASACSGTIKISAVSSRDGKLGLGFTWQEGIVEDRLVDSLIQDLIAQVECIT